MNIKKQLIFILLSICFSSQITFAQRTLSLENALTYALSNVEAIRKAKLDILQGAFKVEEVRASALPQIDGTVTLNNNILSQQFILPAAIMGGELGEFVAVKAGATWIS